MMPRPPDRVSAARSAFTLVEVVAAMGATAVLLAAMVSVLMLGTRALPGSDDAPTLRISASAALLQVADDIRAARAIVSPTSRSIEINVGDRDQDGNDDIIVISWSGVPGQPLTRSVNTSDPEAIAQNVHAFSIALASAPGAAVPDGNMVESAPVLLGSYTSSATNTTSDISTTQWVGMHLRPMLPADATGWRPTSFRYQARSDLSSGSSGTTRVELRSSTRSELPETGVLAFGSVAETTSTSYTWRSVNFSGVPVQGIESAVVVILRAVSPTRSSRIAYQNQNVLSPFNRLLITSNSGSSWAGTKDASIQFELWGTVLTPATANATVPRTRAIELTLQCGPDAAGARSIRVATAGRPEAS